MLKVLLHLGTQIVGVPHLRTCDSLSNNILSCWCYWSGFLDASLMGSVHFEASTNCLLVMLSCWASIVLLSIELSVDHKSWLGVRIRTRITSMTTLWDGTMLLMFLDLNRISLNRGTLLEQPLAITVRSFELWLYKVKYSVHNDVNDLHLVAELLVLPPALLYKTFVCPAFIDFLFI